MTNLVNSKSTEEVINDYKPALPRFIKAIDDMAECMFASKGFAGLPKLSKRNTFHYYRQLRQLISDFNNLSGSELSGVLESFHFDVGGHDSVKILVTEFGEAFKAECDSPLVQTFDRMEDDVLGILSLFKALYKKDNDAL